MFIKLTDEQVVDIYMDAHLNGLNLAKEAKALGVSRAYLDMRAKRLRNAGVNIPHKYSRPDVDALNKRIEEKKAL